MRRYIDDAFVLTGAVLGGVGVYTTVPAAVWFYAAAWCIGIGYVIGRVK